MLNEKKEIEPKDSNGDWHGYQEWYTNGDLWLRCNYKHGRKIGYRENHRHTTTYFYIK